jgi:boron transporter
MATQTETVTTPSSSRAAPQIRRRSSSHSAQKKPWQHPHRPSFHSSHSRPAPEEIQRLAEQVTRQTTRSSARGTNKWYKIRWFKGITDDIKRRAPYYWSDWRDAWDYSVIPATVYMYFAKYAQSKPAHHTTRIVAFTEALMSTFFTFTAPRPCSVTSMDCRTDGYP